MQLAPTAPEPDSWSPRRWWTRVNAPEANEVAWSWPRRFAFRALFAFWVLGYGLPAPFNLVPGIPDGLDAWQWLGRHLGTALGLEVPTHGMTGSGDTLLDWLTKLALALLALVVAAAWSLVQRAPVRHGKLLDFLQLLVRLILGQVLFSYGIIKLFGSQFPAPSPDRLLSTYGESSPMGLMWTFIGASLPYQIFGGAMETLAGALLAFRRTRTVGALLTCGVMGNVFVLNLCYDVPVKLLSGELTAMAIFLAALDAPRLLSAVVLNRPLPAADERFAFWSTKRWSVLRRVLTAVTVVAGVAMPIPWRGSPMPPADPDSVAGAYDVVSAEGVEGVTRLGLMPWGAKVFFTGAPTLRVKATEDVKAKQIALAPRPGEPGVTASLSWRQDGEHLIFSGTWNDAPVTFTVTKLDTSKSLLMTRGFHWVNEFPFNR